MQKNTRTIVTPRKGERYIRMAKPTNEVHPDWVRLANAVAEIATNQAAPSGLREPVLDFLNSNSGEIWGKLMLTHPVIQQILVAARIKETEADDDN